MHFLPFVAALWQLTRIAQPGLGRQLEHEVRELLVAHRLRSDRVPGGYSLLGVGSASGLWHQIDVEVHLNEAIIVGELKAYSGPLPKNHVLNFVAATDDLFLGKQRRSAPVPIYRAIAGTFSASEAARTYAAMHGVVLIEPTTVPAPILASSRLPLPVEYTGLTEGERSAVASLTRPVQDLWVRGSADSVHRVMRRDGAAFRFGICAQRQWSDRLLSADSGPSPQPVAVVAA